MRFKQFNRVLPILLIIGILTMAVSPAYALGDYHYLWLNKKVKIMPHDSLLQGEIIIGCEAYCFWDRVIQTKSKSAYAYMNEGDFEIISTANLSSTKINDYRITISGPVQIRTIQKYTVQAAKDHGLIAAGFISGNMTASNDHYYKIIQIHNDIQP